MHSLARVEAERVVALLDETIAKVRLVSCVPRLPSRAAVAELGDRASQRATAALWATEAERETWLTRQQHEVNVLDLARALSADPIAPKILAKHAGMKAHMRTNRKAMGSLVANLEALSTSTLVKMSTTVEEEIVCNNRVRELRLSYAALSDDRIALTRALVRERAVRERKELDLDREAAKLKKYRKENLTRSDHTFVKLSKETAAKHGEMDEAHKKRKQRIEEDFVKHDEVLEKTRSALEKDASHHVKHKNQAVNHLKQAVASFDSAISTKRAELEALRAAYARETERFEHLDAHFSRIDEEKGRALHEEECIADEIALRAYADKMIAECVTGMQKVRRAKIGRAAAKKAAKKGGKGKKK